MIRVFFRKLFRLIPDTNSTNLIIGGDFNCYLDPYLDRQSSQAPPSIQSVNVLNNLIKSMNLVDIWRLLNPTARDYSFFSYVHKSYTRIDYFIIDSKLIQGVTYSKYHNILISDHCPISMGLKISLTKAQYCWRFNSQLLMDKQFQSYITECLGQFVKTNDKGDVSDSCLWETCKVVLRGHIIAYESSLKREKRRRLSEIESILPSLEQVFRVSKSQTDLNAILKLKYEYNSILNDQVSNLLIKLKQKQFELGDKADKLLARQLRGVQASRAIHQIKSQNGTLLTHPKEINNRFAEFYKHLYSSSCLELNDIGCQFLDAVDFPKLNESAREELEEPFSLCEILEAISSFSNGKATGPDGFSVEFYKANANVIAPLMLRMINHSIEKKKFPDSLYEAHICVLKKKDRDVTEPSSYRPISLLNFDQKVIAKILATRLNKHVASLIHPDQTGFVPGRFSFFNSRRLLNILYNNQSKSSKAAVLSIDAEKAFDRIEYSYMFSVLDRFGFGENFKLLIKMLYSSPKSAIITNSDKSAFFPLQRGTRQGCCLSPLLFDLALEPLAIHLRNHSEIRGITCGHSEVKVSLYADDLLLYLDDPSSSLPFLMESLGVFGSFSGYSVNWEKSVFMPLGEGLDAQFLRSLPFRISEDHFTYLGLIIPKHCKHIFSLNFTEAINKLKLSIDKWRALPLSLIGRVNAIKMVSLPRFVYLFQNLPVYLPHSFFKQLDSVIFPFIWGYKAHRISKAHLHKPKELGGLALPVFRHYYWATNARAMMFWQMSDQTADSLIDSLPKWLYMEARSVVGSSLATILFF